MLMKLLMISFVANADEIPRAKAHHLVNGPSPLVNGSSPKHSVIFLW